MPADLTAPDTLGRLPRADAAFLVFPSIVGDPAAPQVVTALAGSVRDAAGRIAYLSAHGAQDAAGEPGIMGSHALLEGLIRESGASWTFLRSSGFAANTLGWADGIRATGTVRWPAGGAKRALIHEDDLAAVAVQSLTGAGGREVDRQVLHLTGPQQFTQREYAEQIGDVKGRPVEFVELQSEQAMTELFAGLPESFARSIIDGQHAMIANPEPVTATVTEVLGRPARTFGEWVADHRAAFTGPISPAEGTG